MTALALSRLARSVSHTAMSPLPLIAGDQRRPELGLGASRAVPSYCM